MGFPGGSVVVSACQCRRRGFHPWVRKILRRRKWQPTPVFLPGKSCGQRSLASYSPWDCKSRTWISNSLRLINKDQTQSQPLGPLPPPPVSVSPLADWRARVLHHSCEQEMFHEKMWMKEYLVLFHNARQRHLGNDQFLLPLHFTDGKETIC